MLCARRRRCRRCGSGLAPVPEPRRLRRRWRLSGTGRARSPSLRFSRAGDDGVGGEEEKTDGSIAFAGNGERGGYVGGGLPCYLSTESILAGNLKRICWVRVG